MLIFISPSKTFTDNLNPGNPVIFKEKSNYLFNQIQSFSYDEVIKNFKVSNDLANEIYGYYHSENKPSRAVFRYGGVLYKALDPSTILFNDFNKLFIFSGQYGLLHHDDEIKKYRIDFNHRMLGNLYHYWIDDIQNYLNNDYKDELLIDLTSKEFEQLIPSHKIRIDFELLNKKISTVLLKQLRGLFARHILTNNLTTLSDVKRVNLDGFTLDINKSTESNLIFVK